MTPIQFENVNAAGAALLGIVIIVFCFGSTWLEYIQQMIKYRQSRNRKQRDNDLRRESNAPARGRVR